MEACYGGAGVMERSCAVARGKDISTLIISDIDTLQYCTRSAVYCSYFCRCCTCIL
jgi:hypothetical protein